MTPVSVKRSTRTTFASLPGRPGKSKTYRAIGYELASAGHYEFAGFAGQVPVRIVGIWLVNIPAVRRWCPGDKHPGPTRS